MTVGRVKHLGRACAPASPTPYARGDTTAVTQVLTQLAAAADTPPQLQALLPKLLAILHGDRDPALADDPALDFRDAAELRLLLEKLAEQ